MSRGRSGGRSGRGRGRPRSGRTSDPRRQGERTARVGHLVQEIVASELARIAPEDGPLLTVTGVAVDAEFSVARVFMDHLDEEQADLIEQLRPRLQRAVAGQVRLRRTPTLVFLPDPGIEAGERVDEVLRTLAGEEHEEDGDAGHDDA